MVRIRKLPWAEFILLLPLTGGDSGNLPELGAEVGAEVGAEFEAELGPERAAAKSARTTSKPPGELWILTVLISVWGTPVFAGEPTPRLAALATFPT